MSEKTKALSFNFVAILCWCISPLAIRYIAILNDLCSRWAPPSEVASIWRGDAGGCLLAPGLTPWATHIPPPGAKILSRTHVKLRINRLFLHRPSTQVNFNSQGNHSISFVAIIENLPVKISTPMIIKKTPLTISMI